MVLPGQIELPSQVTTQRASLTKDTQKLKTEYDHLMTKRLHSSKILDVTVKVQEGLTPGTSKFWVQVDRENKMTNIMEQCYISYFGYTEWMEMVDVFIAK